MIAAADKEKCGPHCCEILLSHGGQITDEIIVSAVFNENFPIQLLKLFVTQWGTIKHGLAEIPRSDGNPEIYDFLAHALMVQRICDCTLIWLRVVKSYVARDTKTTCKIHLVRLILAFAGITYVCPKL